MSIKPIPLKVKVENIPSALICEIRWTNWDYRLEGKRWAKALTSKSNKPETWLTFEEALARLKNHDGIGLFLGDGWVGIDFDNCIIESVVLEKARQLISSIGCNSVISPSNTGYKLFFKSNKGIGYQIDYTTNKRQNWTSRRYFTVTGHGSGDPTVYHELTTEPVVEVLSNRTGYKNPADCSDDELLNHIIGNPTKQSDTFLSLFRGDKKGYKSHSETDLALCSILAFWTNFDSDRVDKIFQSSNLMRDKWQGSYKRSTIAKAMQ